QCGPPTAGGTETARTSSPRGHERQSDTEQAVMGDTFDAVEGSDEPVRGANPGSVAAPETGRGRRDAGSGGVLHHAGGADRGGDRDPSPADGRPGAPEAGLPQGGDPTADVADGGGVDRDARETQRVAAPGAGAARPVDVPRFTPTGQHELGVAGVRPRLHANLEALRTLRQIQAETRPATADEQRVLARWSGWGAIAQQ